MKHKIINLSESCKRRILNRNKIVENYLHLVNPIAQHYAIRSGQEREDLSQAGILGLIKASEKYSILKKPTFTSFAKAHIRGSILHYLRDKSALVRLPRHLEERAQQLLKEQAQSGNPNGMKIDQVDAMLMNSYSFKHQWRNLDDIELASEEKELNKLINMEQYQTVNRVLMSLPNEEREAIHHVVICGDSLRSTAEVIGVSAMTIQRRVKRGLQQLRQQCAYSGVVGFASL